MYKESWNLLLDKMKEEIPPYDFEAWFNPIKYIHSTEDNITLSVPMDFNRIWLKDNYLDRINQELNNIIGRIVQIEVVIEENYETIKDDKSTIEQLAPVKTIIRKQSSLLKQHDLDPSKTFDRFIVGENNALANAAALKVAQNPGTVYNPLFLYGGVGLGKTHLMHAVGQQLQKKDINRRIAYMTSEEFMNLFVESIRKNTMNKFRNEFRNLDVLLLDDVQYLLDKKDSKQELFNTFNALHGRKKQIILTSDRTPEQLKLDGMDDRLSSRIGGGLDVEIRPPSIETKQAILMAKVEEEKIQIPNDVITFIAEIIDTDIRKLEKALTKVIAEHRLLNKKEITLDSVKLSLKDIADGAAPKNISIEDIIRETANVYNISKSDIKSKSRTSQINQARQIVMFLCRKYTSLSYKEIGMELGKEHPTIISGEKKIRKELETNPKLNNKVEEIEENLKKH